MNAVILAGGKGARLKPYTLILPKPLMPVGELPVIEIMLKWLRRNGIRNVFITIGYLGKLLKSICGDGSQWDIEIVYSEEKEPLGTIGPIRLLKDHLKESFLVLNGDLITDLNIREFVEFHRKNSGILTVGGIEKNVKVDLGVLEIQNDRLIGFKEKPTISYTASMGIYCMEPDILKIIPEKISFGFDDLMFTMLDKKLPVSVYKHHGYWLDIGRKEDFALAQEKVETINNYAQDDWV